MKSSTSSRPEKVENTQSGREGRNKKTRARVFFYYRQIERRDEKLLRRGAKVGRSRRKNGLSGGVLHSRGDIIR